MADLEINSPQTGSVMPRNFSISGATAISEVGKTVTCTVTGGSSPGGPYTTLVDASGQWHISPTAIGDGNDYVITATMTGAGSDEVNDVDVEASPPIMIQAIAPPIPTPPDLLPDRSIKISGTFRLVTAGDPLSARVFVLIHVFRARKSSKVFAAGFATTTTDATVNGTWEILLPTPAAGDPRRLVIQAIRLNKNGKVLHRTSKKEI